MLQLFKNVTASVGHRLVGRCDKLGVHTPAKIPEGEWTIGFRWEDAPSECSSSSHVSGFLSQGIPKHWLFPPSKADHALPDPAPPHPAQACALFLCFDFGVARGVREISLSSEADRKIGPQASYNAPLARSLPDGELVHPCTPSQGLWWTTP